MKTFLRAAAVTAALAVSPAFAADLGVQRVAVDSAITATDFSPWMIRLRALVVLPQASGAVNVLNGTTLGSPLGNLSASTSVVPELDITYFFTKNIAAELILGVTPHTVSPKGDLATALASTANIGRAWLLPPTLMLQYHFTELGAFKPYVGVGVNYTMFFSQKPLGALAAMGYDRFSVSSAFGVALQAGFDYMIDRHWGVNVDVKKIFLRSNWKYTDTTGTLAVTSGRATLDPWLISAGITYRF